MLSSCRPALRICVKIAANLSSAVLCTILLCCSGCFQRKITIEDGYRLTENTGAPMLIPIGGPSSDTDKLQKSIVVLPGSSAKLKDQVSHQCAIGGQIFSIRRASPGDSKHWIIRSPAISGWNTLAGEFDIDSEWRTFTRDLARMNEEGCFPAGLTSVDIRLAIAQRIPLPANEVPSFFYSGQEMGIIDLAPGMEVRLQQILPAGKSISARSKSAFQMWLANYVVLSRHGDGVRLKLTRKSQTGPKIGSESEEREFFSLSQRFAQSPVLRVLLKGFTGNHQASDAILIGASSDKQLNLVSGLILQKDPATCVDYHETVCMRFPRDGLSLFSTIWIDGHRTSYPFGTPFGAVLRSLPRAQQLQTLQSAHVFRRLSAGHYAEIEFPRTPRGASELLLLPGDRIQSQH